MARSKGSFFSNFRLFDSSDERVSKLLGLLMVFLSAYLLIAYVSYLFTWQADQDIVLRFSWDLLFMGEQKMDNWLGRLGAIMSNGLVYYGFGLASIGIIYLLYIYGRAMIIGAPLSDLRMNLRHTAILMVFFSILLRFLAQNSGFPFGGEFGKLVCDWIIKFVGNIGMLLLLLLLFVAIITWNFNPDYNTLTAAQAKDNTHAYLQDWWYKRYRGARRAATNTGSLSANIDTSTDNNGSNTGGRTFTKVYNSVESIGDLATDTQPLETIKAGATGTNTDALLDENNQLAMNIGQSNVTLPKRGLRTGAELEIEEGATASASTDSDPEMKKMERLIDGFDD